MFNSLTSRFVVSSFFILPLFLVLSFIGLNTAFQQSLSSGEQERLKTHLYLLLGAAEVSDNGLWMPDQFQEPRLNQISSGLYGVVYDKNYNEIWRSPSAKLVSFLPHQSSDTSYTEKNPVFDAGKTLFSTSQLAEGEAFVFSQHLVWELESGNESAFIFSIYHNKDEFIAEIKTYQNQLWKWLGVFVIGLLIAQVVILRWALNPLKNLASDLKDIESGEITTLEGEYPSEIQPVTNNLNHVISVEQKQREKYRTTLDDLAHSLKTPLSVIQSTIENSSSEKANDSSLIISQQTEHMNQIVQHQLQRAVLGHNQSIGEHIAILPIIERIVDSLKKVYREKNVSTDINVDQQLTFIGDERDLFELLGNIIENAFKYSKHNVRISNIISEKEFTLLIEDDGDGVPENERETILARGARIDTVKPGQGIGLSVALEIISSYNGSLSVGKSALGGASFQVTFVL